MQSFVENIRSSFTVCPHAGTEPQTQGLAGDSSHTFFSGSKASTTLGGKASEQPERTPLSKEEIEAIMEKNQLGEKE
ncbi:hypothetical protein C1H46_021096 [Malus baccata]|uniref:Uncharacterized protein n=1 Tax=Malus baccata TaxID=106549 RepID=A0A540M3F3_MALBA|nr:hypothetical protein C1H46_021096 [Malus baccata]